VREKTIYSAPKSQKRIRAHWGQALVAGQADSVSQSVSQSD